jgi:hypothetical protein
LLLLPFLCPPPCTPRTCIFSTLPPHACFLIPFIVSLPYSHPRTSSPRCFSPFFIPCIINQSTLRLSCVLPGGLPPASDGAGGIHSERALRDRSETTSPQSDDENTFPCRGEDHGQGSTSLDLIGREQRDGPEAFLSGRPENDKGKSVWTDDEPSVAMRDDGVGGGPWLLGEEFRKPKRAGSTSTLSCRTRTTGRFPAVNPRSHGIAGACRKNQSKPRKPKQVHKRLRPKAQ